MVSRSRSSRACHISSSYQVPREPLEPFVQSTAHTPIVLWVVHVIVHEIITVPVTYLMNEYSTCTQVTVELACCASVPPTSYLLALCPTTLPVTVTVTVSASASASLSRRAVDAEMAAAQSTVPR